MLFDQRKKISFCVCKILKSLKFYVKLITIHEPNVPLFGEKKLEIFFQKKIQHRIATFVK